MESISPSEIESIDRMLSRYTDHFELDELNEDEAHAILYDNVFAVYSKLKPEPAKVNPTKLKTITKEEKEAMHELIETLIGIFESVGVEFEELRQFRNLCRFYKRIVPTWKAPESLAVKLDY